MAGVSAARRRILRAVLSALAGGGLTAAGLTGPLTGSALAVNTPVSTAGSPATPATTSTSAELDPETSSGASSPMSSSSSTEATTSTPATTAPAATTPTAPIVEGAPMVVGQREQQKTAGTGEPSPSATTTTTGKKTNKEKNAKLGETRSAAKKAAAENKVAASPESVAEEGVLAAALDSSGASAQVLDFYRIPLFLLPIYKAAAVQYGVPWQVLAAINEVETDYGNDLSVSTAGAVGWMQFMPSTWLQYGVDALDAGYADPYNPVDAIFASARYLRAAGAQTNLRAAILTYNHSQEYASSVLLRAKLISAYPKAVISTLTGLIDARLPVTGKRLAWSAPVGASSSTSSATAGASAIPSKVSSASTPGSAAAPSPTAAAAASTSGAAASSSSSLDFDELTSVPNASVVAVADGRIVKIGDSHRLGKYVVLRDVYGDVFTYAGLGSIAASYSSRNSVSTPTKSSVVEAASTRAPTPTQPATAGTQSPLDVKTSPQIGLLFSSLGQLSVSLTAKKRAPAGTTNAGAVAAHTARRTKKGTSEHLALRRGSVVASGTVLGHVSIPGGDRDGHLRFAIQPAGDTSTIDAGPLLASWKQLQTALHPHGAKASNALLGATTSDLFLMSNAQLERVVLADRDITIDTCDRHEVAAGRIDKRVLAVLAFLSRSGLAPTVSALRCGQNRYTASGAISAQYQGDAVDISAINGIPVARHQGAGTITDLTVRALLTVPSGFVPHEIISLMRYPKASNTRADASFSKDIRLEFSPATAAAPSRAVTATVAHSARAGHTAPTPLLSGTSVLSAAEWNKLMRRVATLPTPTLATKPSSAAVADPKRR
jgi:soluble lytic murein transglycosylase-like protein